MRALEKEFEINFDEYLSKEKSNIFILPETASNSEKCEKFVSGYIEIKKLILDTEKELIEFDETLDIITIETDMLVSKNKEAEFLKRITYAFSFIGIILSITGFSLWFQRHQFYQDKLLKLNYQINEFQKKNFIYDDSIRLINNRRIKDSTQLPEPAN